MHRYRVFCSIRTFLLVALTCFAWRSENAIAIELFSAGMEVPETISLVPQGFGAYEGDYLVPDPGYDRGDDSKIWVVPANGGAPNVLATIPIFEGGTGTRGGIFLPSNFGSHAGAYLTSVVEYEHVSDFQVQQRLTRFVTVDSSGGVRDFLRYEFDRSQDQNSQELHIDSFSQAIVAPQQFGNLAEQVLFATINQINAVDPSGHLTNLFSNTQHFEETGQSVLPFGLGVAPDDFGAYGGRLFLSGGADYQDGMSRILAMNSNGTWDTFATLATGFGPGQLRNLDFVPDGFGDLSGKLLLSVSGSRFGGGALGKVLAFDSTGKLYKQLKVGSQFDRFDPRGFYFTEDGRILISDASDPILSASVADFTLVPEPSGYALAAIGAIGLSLFVRRSAKGHR
jgi:hypothetical protein